MHAISNAWCGLIAGSLPTTRSVRPTGALPFGRTMREEDGTLETG
jgi:hypothetical protein